MTKLSDLINSHGYELCRNTENVDMLVARMVPNPVIKQRILLATIPPYTQNDRFYEYMRRRPDDELEKLLDAMDESENGHLADMLVPTRVKREEEKNNMYGHFLESVRSMCPMSVNIYGESMPKSRVCIEDHPYVLAHYLGTRNIDRCPIGMKSALARYKREMIDTEKLLDLLTSCDVMIKLRFSEVMKKSMQVLQCSVLKFSPDYKWSDDKRSRACALLHTMTYAANFSIAIRRDFESSSYLLMNADENSIVVRDQDKKYVREAIENEEINFDVSSPF